MPFALDLLDDPVIWWPVSNRLARRFITGAYGESLLIYSLPPTALLELPHAAFAHEPSYYFQYRQWLQHRLERSGLCYLFPNGRDALPDIADRLGAPAALAWRAAPATSYEQQAHQIVRDLDFYIDYRHHAGRLAGLIGLVAGTTILAAGLAALMALAGGLAQTCPGCVILMVALILAAGSLAGYACLSWREDTKRIEFLGYCLRALADTTDSPLEPVDPRIRELQKNWPRPRLPWEI